MKHHKLMHLEFIRGLAAVIVVLSHITSFILIDYPMVKHPNLPTKVLYFIGGLGHEAVMVFFVLSGFLIIRSINLSKSNFSWRCYLFNRLSRLWVVLIPALFMTVFWDQLGMHFTNSGFYNGTLRDIYHSGPTVMNHENNSSIGTFFLNIFFLQELITVSYGTNGPLWSLAYEFWYYILFPLAFIGYYSVGIKRVLLLNIFVLIIVTLFYLSNNLVLLWSVWLLGGLSVWLTMNKKLYTVLTNKYLTGLLVAVFLLSIVLSRGKITHGYFAEISIGFIFSLLVVSLSKASVTTRLYSKIASYFSNISYSLYLTHFPFIGFICSMFLNNEKYPPSLQSLALICVLLILSIIYGYVFYWCFERNTKKIKAKFNIINRFKTTVA